MSVEHRSYEMFLGYPSTSVISNQKLKGDWTTSFDTVIKLAQAHHKVTVRAGMRPKHPAGLDGRRPGQEENKSRIENKNSPRYLATRFVEILSLYQLSMERANPFIPNPDIVSSGSTPLAVTAWDGYLTAPPNSLFRVVACGIYVATKSLISKAWDLHEIDMQRE